MIGGDLLTKDETGQKGAVIGFRLRPDEFPNIGEIDACPQLFTPPGDVSQGLHDLIAALLDIERVLGDVEKATLGKVDLGSPSVRIKKRSPLGSRHTPSVSRLSTKNSTTVPRHCAFASVFVEVAMEPSRIDSHTARSGAAAAVSR
jgi:hypothetical protein